MTLTRQLSPDEGGFATVARYWTDGGPFLYGPTWVDRPPGLIGLFALAEHLGRYGVRLTAAAAAVLLVAAVALASGSIGGRTAARWAAWLGFALSSSVLLDAERLDGELVAAMFDAMSMASVLRALRDGANRIQSAAYGLGAGLTATAAALTKQNFVDGLVFASVLLLVAAVGRRNRRSYPLGRLVGTAAGLVAGVAVLIGAASFWARAHHGIDALLFALYGFRSAATAVMAQWSWAAPLHRLGVLVAVAAASGVGVLLLHLAYRRRNRLWSTSPLAWALSAAASVELVGVLGGVNYWVHYLIALVPTVAVAGGLSAHRPVPGWRATRRLAVGAVVVTVVASPVSAVQAAVTPSASYTTGRWIADSAHPGDTITVTYTRANIIYASGLRPAYPFMWSLPTRTLDPQLSVLTRVLEGPRAPTWVVQWDDLSDWGLDSGHQVEAALAGAYRPAGRVCGRAVWLHDGVHRQLAPAPSRRACGPGAE
jgi:hypothetical protein